MVLGSTASCHFAQGSGVGGQLAAYFLLSLAVPSCNYLDQFNEFDGIRIRNRPTANGGLQQLAKSAIWQPLLVLWWFYTSVVDCLVFDCRNSVPKSNLSTFVIF